MTSKIIRKDNHKGAGNGYKLLGNGIQWSGNGNVIFGNNVIIRGDDNVIFGKGAQVFGNKNEGNGDDARVEGDGNKWKGKSCEIQGQGNTLNGQDIKRLEEDEDEAEFMEYLTEAARMQNRKRVAPEDKNKEVERPSDADLACDKEVSGTDKPCCICLTHVAQCVATPCMHQSYCCKCAMSLTYPNKRPQMVGDVTCAVCRVIITSIKRVY